MFLTLFRFAAFCLSQGRRCAASARRCCYVGSLPVVRSLLARLPHASLSFCDHCSSAGPVSSPALGLLSSPFLPPSGRTLLHAGLADYPRRSMSSGSAQPTDSAAAARMNKHTIASQGGGGSGGSGGSSVLAPLLAAASAASASASSVPLSSFPSPPLRNQHASSSGSQQASHSHSSGNQTSSSREEPASPSMQQPPPRPHQPSKAAATAATAAARPTLSKPLIVLPSSSSKHSMDGDDLSIQVRVAPESPLPAAATAATPAAPAAAASILTRAFPLHRSLAATSRAVLKRNQTMRANISSVSSAGTVAQAAAASAGATAAAAAAAAASSEESGGVTPPSHHSQLQVLRTLVEKQKAAALWHLEPDSTFYRWWLVICCTAIIANTWSVPFRLSIGYSHIHGDVTAWMAVDILCDCIYLTNIILKSRLVRNTRTTQHGYMSTRVGG